LGFADGTCDQEEKDDSKKLARKRAIPEAHSISAYGSGGKHNPDKSATTHSKNK